MKKILSIMISLIVLLTPVFAQTNLKKPKYIPGHPLYGFKRGIEDIRLALTFDSEDRAELHAEYSEERLAEVNELIERNATRYINETMDDFEEEMNKTEEEINNTRGIGKDVSQLVKQVNNTFEKHILVLELVLQKVPENAKWAIEKNINKSIEKLARMTNQTEEEIAEKHNLKIRQREREKIDKKKEEKIRGKLNDEKAGTQKKEENGKPDKGGKPQSTEDVKSNQKSTGESKSDSTPKGGSNSGSSGSAGKGGKK